MNRGQMILAAGSLIVIALIAALLAILQLGYHPAWTTAEDYTPPEETRRVIEETLIEAEPTARAFAWTNRSAAAAEVRPILTGRLNELERTQAGSVRRVELATEVAPDVLSDICPRGPGARFGPCVAMNGIVLQERGETSHLVGVVLRITVKHADGTAKMTMVVRPLPRVVDRPDT